MTKTRVYHDRDKTLRNWDQVKAKAWQDWVKSNTRPVSATLCITCNKMRNMQTTDSSQIDLKGLNSYKH